MKLYNNRFFITTATSILRIEKGIIAMRRKGEDRTRRNRNESVSLLLFCFLIFFVGSRVRAETRKRITQEIRNVGPDLKRRCERTEGLLAFSKTLPPLYLNQRPKKRSAPPLFPLCPRRETLEGKRTKMGEYARTAFKNK